MRRVTLSGLIGLTILGATCPRGARGDFDMTGRWVDTIVEFQEFACGDYVQTGTVLTRTNCDGTGLQTGAIDPMSGAFSFVSLPGTCPPHPATLLEAQLTPDGQAYNGTLTVRTTPTSCLFPITFTVSGVRAHCGDFYADPDAGEQCDDGNDLDGDCCSSTCQIDASGTPCASDGNPCTDDVCTVGACAHENNAAPCNDGNACTSDDQCSGGVCGGTQSCLLDHYQCYQGKDLKSPEFLPVVAATVDQITGGPVTVEKLKYVCAPVDKNGEGVNDPNAHLACYQVKGADLAPPPSVEVITQFQVSRFELKRPKLLCAPAIKTLLP